MARSGMVVVTNRWGPKDLETLSARFVSCDPDAAGIAAALEDAEQRLLAGGDPALRLEELGRPLSDAARALREHITTGGLR
jgi:hypothetical protein